MRLGEALVRLAAIEPHFFNSFYRRVRVVRARPRPARAAASVDITHRCSLRCPFCIASGVRGGAEMAPERFRSLCDELRGIGRLTLLGGEPFLHSRFPELVAAARTAADEVEIFTNGMHLQEGLAAIGAGADAGWLTVVLSVDPDHAAQMGPERMRGAVDELLAAEEAGRCRARFSVTHPRLFTGGYLDSDTVATAIAGSSERLARLFLARLAAGQVEESFYFNPVVCGQPRERGAADPGTGPELLRLEDLCCSPEAALTFDSAGELRLFTALTSIWSPGPPAGTVAGSLAGSGPRFLLLTCGGDAQLAALVANPSQDAPSQAHPVWRELWQSSDLAGRLRLLRAWRPLRELLAWDGGERLVRNQAERLVAVVAGGVGDRAVRFGGEEGDGQLDSLRFRAVLARLGREPAMAERLAEAIAAELTRLFAVEGDGIGAPLFVGPRELLGRRVALAPGERHPATAARLRSESGAGPAHELVVRPVLELWPGGEARLRLGGLEPAGRTSRREATRALVRVARMVVALAGPELLERALALGPPTLRALLPGARPARPLRVAPREDLALAFRECSDHRNRQGADELNPELLALVLTAGRERFGAGALAAFASLARGWLAEWQRHEPLPAAVSALLEPVVK